MKQVEILKLRINHITQNEALKCVSKLAKERKPSYVCFVNSHMVVEANKDLKILRAVNNSTFAFSDGMPVAKAFQLLHGLKQDRIAGMSFFPLMLGQCEKLELKIGLIGSTDEVLNKILQKIKKEFPKIKVTQAISPPFKSQWDNQAYIESFNNFDTNLVFVALGCPKQEKWMFENHKKINAILLGVGGAFPVYAGIIRKCPRIMSDNGLEWLYRFIMEPRRLGKRYLYTNTIFIKLLTKATLKRILR